jgi:hypothetical protein
LLITYQATIMGKNFLPGVVVHVYEAPTSFLTVEYINSGQLCIQAEANISAGNYIISLKNPDGKQSNIVLLSINQ